MALFSPSDGDYPHPLLSFSPTGPPRKPSLRRATITAAGPLAHGRSSSIGGSADEIALVGVIPVL